LTVNDISQLFIHLCFLCTDGLVQISLLNELNIKIQILLDKSSFDYFQQIISNIIKYINQQNTIQEEVIQTLTKLVQTYSEYNDKDIIPESSLKTLSEQVFKLYIVFLESII
jgi:hypothetical protein